MDGAAELKCAMAAKIVDRALGGDHLRMDPVELFFGDKRPQFRLEIPRISHLQGPRLRQFEYERNELVGDVFLYEYDAGGNTALARVAETGIHDLDGCSFQIEIIEDHHRGVPSELHVAFFQLLAGFPSDPFAGLNASGECDFVVVQILDQLLADLSITMNELDESRQFFLALVADDFAYRITDEFHGH